MKQDGPLRNNPEGRLVSADKRIQFLFAIAAADNYARQVQNRIYNVGILSKVEDIKVVVV